MEYNNYMKINEEDFMAIQDFMDVWAIMNIGDFCKRYNTDPKTYLKSLQSLVDNKEVEFIKGTVYLPLSAQFSGEL